MFERGVPQAYEKKEPSWWDGPLKHGGTTSASVPTSSLAPNLVHVGERLTLGQVTVLA